MNSIDSAFTVWSAPTEERANRPYVILLHGRGGNEDDMLRFFGRLPPSFVAASIRGPFGHGNGFSWLDSITSEAVLAERLDDAANELLRWVAASCAGASSVSLLGWSQGGAVALQALRVAPNIPKFVVTLGGFSGPSFQAQDETLARIRPPVFWGRGLLDEVIPRNDIALMNNYLPSHSDLTSVEYEGLGHEISEEEIDDVCAFITAQGAHT